MKLIELKIKYDHLVIINEWFSELPPVGITRADRAERSLLDVLSRKLLKKQLSKQDKQSSKPFKISLEYYEAFALFPTMASALNREQDPYKKNALMMLCNELNRLTA